MILVFGGTTEGRKTVEVLEEGGNTYYYSTKTGEQDITLHHGQRIDGALDADPSVRFPRSSSRVEREVLTSPLPSVMRFSVSMMLPNSSLVETCRSESEE